MLRRKLVAVSALLALSLCTFSLRAYSQTPEAAQPASQRKTSIPYTGDLSIFEKPGRDEKLHIDEVMQVLGIVPGRNVADIGAGSGWFTVRAARKVVPGGTVYAVDINPDAVQYIEKRAAQEKLTNVKVIRGEAGDPHLPKDGIDAVLLLKTYHEVAEPIDLLQNLRSSLRPNARVGIIDRNGNGEDHGIDKAVVIREAQRAGFRLKQENDALVKDDGMDYFLIFQLQ